ncbi:SDR family NAD(P)-dependent oxidoreductase [Kaistella sp.]|uniref:SDR family NAD(P)-dependent oxidoreductase n=1 Tax=Kaistella sp. TaxID=2782235 RepID=UPI003C524998
MKRLLNKIVLVTGANKGIGLSITKKFLGEGAIVYAGIREIESTSTELYDLKSQFLDHLHIVTLDVTDAALCKGIILKIKKEQGRLDILVNNAGKISYELVPFINFDIFEEMLQTNVIGLIRLSSLASRLMGRQKSGSIINMSSIVSVKGAKGQASYAATKGAVNSFTLSLAKELAPDHIRVNAIAPGMVATERLSKVMSDKFEHVKNDIGFGDLAQPEDIANMCLFLASDESSYVTGQIIAVDGSLKI